MIFHDFLLTFYGKKRGQENRCFFQVHEKETLVQYFWCGKFEKEKLQD